MMSRAEAERAIVRSRLIAIVRLSGAEACLSAAGAVAGAGVRIVEFSLAGEGAPAALRASREALGTEVLVGAGTVRTLGDAMAAADAGATFLVSPTLVREVAEWAWENDVLHIPGVLTPNEIEEALRAGARIVKIFPAGPLGPGYLRALRGPFPDLRVVATGGIDATSAGAYLEAGAVAVALGSSLVNEDAVGNPEALTRRAADAVDAIAALGGLH